MANSKPRRHFTARDLDILLALDRCPLTIKQLFELSATFPGRGFGSIRSVQDRLHKMRDAGWVRCWPYAFANRGAPPLYFKPTLLGYRLMHGEDVAPPTKRHFSEIGVARHHHTHSLAEFLVQTLRAANRRGLRLENFYRENTRDSVCAGVRDGPRSPPVDFGRHVRMLSGLGQRLQDDTPRQRPPPRHWTSSRIGVQVSGWAFSRKTRPVRIVQTRSQAHLS